MKLTTISDYGPKLPIGFVQGKKLDKSFALRPHKSWLDRALGIWTESQGDVSEAQIATRYLALAVHQAGPNTLALTADHDCDPMQQAQIATWHKADVMYMYVWARIQAVTEQLEIATSCPRCDWNGTVRGDLNNLEVLVAECVADLRSVLRLKDGMTLRSGKKVHALTLQPPPFAALMVAGSGAGSINSIGYNTLRESVCGVEGVDGRYTLVDDELNDLSKLDLLRLDHQAAQQAAGLKMRTTVACPQKACGTPIHDLLDWRYSHFFEQSVPLALLTT